MRHLYYRGGKLYALISDKKREYFYEDGALKTVEHYEKDRLQGESLLFWGEGRLKRKCSFEKGARHGLDQIWDDEGFLSDEGMFALGKPIGIHRRYKKGKLIEEIEYLADGRFNLSEWDEEGEIRVSALWDGLDYRERVWDRFQNVWVEKEGFWNGKQLVYT